MTNWEKWMKYTDALPTPDNMIQWSWLYTVASALERRVWLGPEHEQLFPNMYVVFVSKPGIGKSFVIRYISSMLRRWYRGDNKELFDLIFKDNKHKVVADVTQEQDKAQATENMPKSKEKEAEISKPYLIKMTPDASTYEALVIAFGKAVGRINYVKKDKDGNPGIGLYIHCSLCCILPEFGSLLRKRANDTVTFLLAVYDCPLDYDYETVTRGRDRIRKGCLNLLAATNPSFMQETLDEKLVNEAFVSRIFYIFASKNRKAVSRIPELTDEQKQYREDLENHILRLTTIYGQLTMEESTWQYIHEWWCRMEEHPELRSSNSPKLDPYYSRKIIHMQKVAIAMHFSEWDGTSMVISLETIKKAIKFLDVEEKSMHLALVLESKDKGALMVRKILDFLREGELNYVDLYMKVYQSLGLLDKKVFEDALEFLRETHEIVNRVEQDKDTGEQITVWRLK
jgi:hypothetical protein